MTRIFPVESYCREMEDENIGAMAFPSSDDRNLMIPTPDDTAAPPKFCGASIAERRAAKFGFNAVKINTARFRTDSPTSSPAIRSPYLTIPPGISPTALLDSPIMLHNSLALPSPTTGTFSLPLFRPENPFPSIDGQNGNAVESSTFKPYLDHKSLLGGATFGNQEFEGGNQTGVSGHQPYTCFEFPTEFPGDSVTEYCREDLSNITIVSACNNNRINITADSKPIISARLSPDMVSEQSLSMEPVHGEDATSHHNDISYGAASRSSEDGYNWRKYGQKQVKGSEYPRSYYKCTNPNCQVKKKVERSLDGQITEIIYKGAHNHAKPLPNRRATLGYDEISEVSEGIGACLRVEGGSAWTNIQSGSDGVEITSSASILTELSDPFTTTRGKSIGVIESTGTPPELSSTVASHDDDEDGAATQGSMSVGGDADGEESESKRRKKESCLVETSLTSRAVREPRVVVQIESEVDILDDGYRWRKYGQKVVKGNPNPRSYYKCTSAGCSVRKHVERASHNLKCVITTYEGKHNHEVPVARNGNHSNSGSGPVTAHQPTASNNPQPRNPAIPKRETQMQDFPHNQFDRKPEFGNDYLRAGFPGNFGPPSIYQMKFPPLQSYAPFGRFAAQQPGPGPMTSILPDFPMPMSSNLPPPGMIGFDFNAVSGYQRHPEAAVRFLRPKQEQRDDVVYDPRMGIGDPAAVFSSSSSSPYNRGLMGGFQS